MGILYLVPFLYKMWRKSNAKQYLKQLNCLRILLVFNAFAFYVVAAHYKGTLVSYLTTPVFPTPIGDFGNLIFSFP